jgi:hypothetical protein
MTVNDAQALEIATLRKLAGAVVSWLVVITLISLGVGVFLLSQSQAANPTAHSIWLCVVGGTLGSSLSALLSAADRISHGWEFSGGDKYPAAEPRDKFVARMVPFFIVRPFFGSAMGLLVYVGLTGGYLIVVQNAQGATFSREGLLFLAFLGGLFAKTFIEKLRAMFDTLFGK